MPVTVKDVREGMDAVSSAGSLRTIGATREPGRLAADFDAGKRTTAL